MSFKTLSATGSPRLILPLAQLPSTTGKVSGGIGIKAIAWSDEGVKPYLLVLLALSPLLQAGDIGSRVLYVGGTVPGVRNKSGASIDILQGDALKLIADGNSFLVPYKDVNTLEYGLRVSRRYVEAVLISPLFLVAKKKTHFLTIGYTDQDGRQQAMVLQEGKEEIRPLLVSLEARTGRRVEYQDEEARKAGKG
jgi:hypothetical protein